MPVEALWTFALLIRHSELRIPGTFCGHARLEEVLLETSKPYWSGALLTEWGEGNLPLRVDTSDILIELWTR